jgi:hypothetical protein
MATGTTRLEEEVLGMLLAGDDPVLHILREQAAEACVRNRKLTGVGFFTRFSVSELAPRLPCAQSFIFGDVIAAIQGLPYGAGFLVCVSSGLLDVLEGYTLSDAAWPDEIGAFSLSYDGGARNLDDIRKSWGPKGDAST